MNLDESGLVGAGSPKQAYSRRNGGSEVPRVPSVPSVPWFRGFHRNEGLVGSGSSSDGSSYEGSVSSKVSLFRCSVVSKMNREVSESYWKVHEYLEKDVTG